MQKKKIATALRYLHFTDLTTHLDEQKLVQEQMIIAYPNPGTNILNIELPGTTQREGTLSILNFEGKTLISRQVTNPGVTSIGGLLQ